MECLTCCNYPIVKSNDGKEYIKLTQHLRCSYCVHNQNINHLFLECDEYLQLPWAGVDDWYNKSV